MKVTFCARAFAPVTPSAEEAERLDQQLLALAQGMSLDHPLSTFSPLVDVDRNGLIVRRLLDLAEQGGVETVQARIFPWLFTR